MPDLYKKYQLHLHYQFLSSQGVESVRYQSAAFYKEYKHWLKEYKKVLCRYADYIQRLKINLYSENIAEVGKGFNDTIVPYPECQMISPYAETLGEDNSVLIVKNNKPYILKNNIETEPKMIKRFITFNPYFDDNLSPWHLIHNNRFDISIGVFGKVYDHDSSSKVRLISDIADKMDGGYIENYDVIDDNYFYNIHSKKRIKSDKPH